MSLREQYPNEKMTKDKQLEITADLLNEVIDEAIGILEEIKSGYQQLSSTPKIKDIEKMHQYVEKLTTIKDELNRTYLSMGKLF